MSNHTSVAEAQSLESVLSPRTLKPSEARALQPFAEDLLNHIRDVLIQSPPAVNVEPAGEPAAESRDWRDMAQARGSIADMISSQPRGTEEALQHAEAGATLAEVCGAEAAGKRVRSTELPKALLRHLLEQQARVLELQETLQMLATHIDEGAGVVAGCARVAHDLNVALDANSLRHVLEGAEGSRKAA